MLWSWLKGEGIQMTVFLSGDAMGRFGDIIEAVLSEICPRLDICSWK